MVCTKHLNNTEVTVQDLKNDLQMQLVFVD